VVEQEGFKLSQGEVKAKEKEGLGALPKTLGWYMVEKKYGTVTM